MQKLTREQVEDEIRNAEREALEDDCEGQREVRNDVSDNTTTSDHC